MYSSFHLSIRTHPYRTLSRLLSQTFTMAAPLHINLAFSCLPPSLTIFCISVSITQTTHLTSRYVSGKTATVVSPRRIIIQEGSRTGWTEKDFAERARRKGEGEGFVLDVDKEGNAGQFWRWRKLARMVSWSSIPSDGFVVGKRSGCWTRLTIRNCSLSRIPSRLVIIYGLQLLPVSILVSLSRLSSPWR
jgi:hypothetical protein